MQQFVHHFNGFNQLYIIVTVSELIASIVPFRQRNFIVWGDSDFVNGRAARSEILGNGHLVSGSFIAYGEYALDNALAIALDTDCHRSGTVPQGPCEDFGRTGA